MSGAVVAAMHASAMREEQAHLRRQPSALASPSQHHVLLEGERVHHHRRGDGEIVEVNPGSAKGTTVIYDSGETYAPS